LCSQDVVVALMAVRHDRDENVTRVGALSIAALPEFPRLEPVRASIGVILSDAYRSGGTLEVRFQTGLGAQRARPQPNPRRVVELMRAAGCPPGARATAIDAEQASVLFAHCARLPERVCDALDRGPVSLKTAASFAALSGLWDAVHLEVILGAASDPELLLRGGAHPLRRLAEVRDREALRAAIMAGTLMLAIKHRGDGTERHDDEDNLREVDFHYVGGVLRYATDSPLECGWWWGSSPPASDRLDVLVCAAGKDTLPARLPDALVTASAHDAGVLVARDFASLTQAERTELERQAAALGAPIMVAPEYTLALDAEAERRMARARTTRL
jgi:hypothetical protein